MSQSHSTSPESLDPAWEEEVREVGPIEVDLGCDQCGASLRWDPAADALACEHCGSHQPVPRAEGTILERPLDEADRAARGHGLEQRVVRCGDCGARVRFEERSTSTHCAFCGSPQLLDPESRRNPLRPESIIPLDVARAEVQREFGEWIKSRWFRPNALKKTRDIDAIGVYVPAWTFDADVLSDWTADSGTYYYVTVTRTVMVNGKPQRRQVQERRVRWRPASGDRRDVYDDLQVLASHGLRRDLARKLAPFDTTEFVPFRPEYLAGWHAEEYQIDLMGAFEEAQRRIDATQRRRCAGDVPGDTHRNLRVQNTLRDVRWKHVLLPLWIVGYRFRGKPYAVVVHGQKGGIVGEAPLSWWKIAFAVLAVVAIVLAIVLVSRGF